MTEANRFLSDQAFDHIDYALGRPVDPIADTSYRNYFAIGRDAPLAREFEASEHWMLAGQYGDMAFFHVTTAGRAALRDHLRAIDDKHRAYLVRWHDEDVRIVATSHSKAKYACWLKLSDCLDVTFKEFVATARVRVVREVKA